MADLESMYAAGRGRIWVIQTGRDYLKIIIRYLFDTHTVVVGIIIHQILSKCVLLVTGTTETEACGNLNLCAGLGLYINVDVPWPITASPNDHRHQTRPS